MGRINLKELDGEEIAAFIGDIGLPGFRASQLIHWIYEKKAGSIPEITEFSKKMRDDLGKIAYISGLRLTDRLASADGTEKFIFASEDGVSIESVLIPEDRGRLTLCVSTQAGCAMGCRFCLTGKGGLKRNLKAHEITDQVIAASRLIAPMPVSSIVMMGMGEPMRNFQETVEALDRITKFLRFSGRRVTVSTSGVVDKMLELPRRATYVNLAVSLNATTDAQRNGIMPVNRKYPLRTLVNACRTYPLPGRSRITFEYVLLDGYNDTDADARRLISLIKNIPSKVNLIPLNEFEGSDFRRPSRERVLSFQKVLIEAGITAFIRKSKGQDILAACGQLGSKR